MNSDKIIYRILVVEDNPGDYLLVEDFLGEHFKSPELTHFTKFKGAKALIDESPDAFDVILLDLSLPDIDKEKLVAEARNISQTIPVIILTGYTDLDFAVKSLAQGVSDYLIKDTITALVLFKSILYAQERHRFLQSLRESEKRYMELFHLSPAPIWVYESDSMRFMDVNEAAVRHYGYSKEEFLSMTIREIRPEEEIPKLEKSISESKGKINRFYSGEFKHQKKSGEVIDVEITSNPIVFDGKQAEIVLATDVTEKLMHMNAIEEQNKRLRDIAWTQSHIVRAPVARMMGLVDMIKNGQIDAEEQAEYLRHIYNSAEEIDEIIKGIVEASQTVFNLEKTN
jgi:PAS domain S-box-containing protein